MHLHAVLTRDDLAETLHELTPLRIELGPQRVVTFDKPEAVELVNDRGLRVRGTAGLVWDVAGIPISASVRLWQLLLVPSVVEKEGEHMLVFDPIVEALDLRRIPGFVDDRIADAINGALAEQRRHLAWRFGRTLSVRLALPSLATPGGTFELAPTGGQVSVTESSLSLTIAFVKRVTRLAAPRETGKLEPAA